MKKTFTLFFIFLLCLTWSFAQDCTLGNTIGSTPCTFGTATTNGDGVLTIPAGVTMIQVEAYGAGGGSLGNTNRRAGGGGGGYFLATYAVTAGATFPITVGEGNTAMSGGNTTFNIGGAVTVGGGVRGANQEGAGGIVTGTGTITEDGGMGGDREEPVPDLAGGGGGGSGENNGDGQAGGTSGGGVGGAGGTAGSPGAAGGAGGAENVPGTDGAFPGGGGGGQGLHSVAGTGSKGGNGRVVVSVVAVVPVQLVHFNADAKDNKTLLEWQTASEVNNEGFEIQKSKDGIAWDMIDFVKGKGNSSVLNTYTSSDKVPTQGSNYYRLKQMDFDGRFEYSKTVVVDFNSRLMDVSLFPNPAKSQLTLVNGEGKATIFNTLGQPIKRLSVNDSQTDIQLTDLLSGQYYLQVVREDGTIVNKNFLKVD